MTDPLSVAGSAVGVISLGITVTQSLVNFYNSYNDLASDLAGTTKRLESLSDTFRHLEATISYRKFRSDEKDLISNIETSVKGCDDLIHELEEEWSKFSKPSSNDTRTAIKVAGRRITYPFRQSTLQKIDEDVDDIRANLSSALSVLQLKDNQRTQDDLEEVRTLLNLVKVNQISSNLRDWLKAPDATIDHNTACLKKHPGTGAWLITDTRFRSWLSEENSLLWLNGFAGSGKSVLCSTVIQAVLRHRNSDPRIGIAFFYFTFNDKSKQDASSMLRSLLLQLSTQLQDNYADLAQLYDSYKTSTPPSRVLVDYLRRLIERFQHVYIILDALDESPRDGARGYLLDTLEAIRVPGLQGMQGLHLFVTSRDEKDIRDFFDVSADQQSNDRQISMRNAGIDEDIAGYVSGRLDTDRRLRKWLPYRDKIQDALADRAKGVFRWVDCQFKSLEGYPCSEYHLDHLLSSLPQSLDATYERMLCNIEQGLIKDARRILTLLCFASRPLTVPELIDGIAMEIGDSVGLNLRHRLLDTNSIQEICPGFIDIGLTPSYKVNTDNEGEAAPIVRIAHFSVQEYLESERILSPKAAKFALTNATAQSDIARICLGYLLEPRLPSSTLDYNVLTEYPLAHYAAMYWFHHYESSANLKPEIDKYIVSLFERKESYINWVRLHDIDEPWDTSVFFRRANDDIPYPVYYISLLGLDRVLHDVYSLASTQHSENASSQAVPPRSTPEILRMINSQGGRYGNALQAASLKGHKKTLHLLLDKGAEVNASGGRLYGNAIQAASFSGDEKIVQLLLDRGAAINAKGGEYYGNALQAASLNGHEKVVQLLLDRGAEVNAQGGECGNALQAASFNGHEKVVQLLLDRGAEVNAQGGDYGNALQAASLYSHEKVIQYLLNKGAEVNAQGGEYGNALQAASIKGCEKIVQLLLDRGAEVNAQGGHYGNALQAASINGREKIIQLLLDRGAEVNAQGGYYGNALQAASLNSNERIVQLLLDRGAKVNSQGGEYGNALQAAMLIGHERIVQLLLDRGAEVNAQGGQYSNALQAASIKGCEKMMKLLLDKGAEVNAQGGHHGTALRAASFYDHEKAVQLLYDHGAESDWMLTNFE